MLEGLDPVLEGVLSDLDKVTDFSHFEDLKQTLPKQSKVEAEENDQEKDVKVEKNVKAEKNVKMEKDVKAEKKGISKRDKAPIKKAVIVKKQVANKIEDVD